MIDIKIDGVEAVTAALRQYPKEASRAAEKALDKTAREIKSAIGQAMPQVFDRPTRYTLNSLKLTLTQNHNMQAKVWFKDPERMARHYLEPQVIGKNNTRRLKGFEWALGGKTYIPGRYAPLDQYGNISAGKIRQILSVLGRAEHVAGYAANLTARSAKRGKTPRDYVWFPKGMGKLPPGIYERFTTAAPVAIKGRARTLLSARGKGHAAWQQGKGGVVRARGLRAILVESRKKTVRQRLPFFEISHKVFAARFLPWFDAEMRRVKGWLPR